MLFSKLSLIPAMNCGFCFFDREIFRPSDNINNPLANMPCIMADWNTWITREQKTYLPNTIGS